MSLLPLILLLATLGVVPDDDPPVARADELVLRTSDFGQWLVERVGTVHVQQFLIERLALREAQRRGVAPTPDEVRQACAEEEEVVVRQAHHGDRERWATDLENKGLTPERWRARRQAELLPELALKRLARLDRQVDDATLQQLYGEVYGATGEAVELEALFYGAFTTLDEEAVKEDIPSGKAQAQVRAREAMTRLRAGAPLEELLPDSDAPSSEFVVDGRIRQYRKRLLGPEVERAVASLDDPGDTSEPVAVWDGYWVLRLVQRRQVDFEQAKNGLIAIAREAPVTGAELSATSDRLLRENDAEILLR